MNRLACFRKSLGIAVFAVMALMFGGCETLPTQPGGASQAVQNADTAGENVDISTVFRRGDKLIIEFTDVATTFPPVYQQIIREDGSISLPYNQVVDAAGKTKRELEEGIHQVYVPKFFRRMTVNVKPEERFFYVRGEVKLPGQKLHPGQMTVMKAISAAGDFTDFANRSHIEVIRSDGSKIKVNGKKLIKNPSLDVPVYPNDTVFVDRRFW